MLGDQAGDGTLALDGMQAGEEPDGVGTPDGDGTLAGDLAGAGTEEMPTGMDSTRDTTLE